MQKTRTPLWSTEFGGLSHAHPPRPKSPSANGLSHLQALIARVPFDIQLRGLAVKERAAASDMYSTQVRRSPSTTDAISHLETVSRWKGITYAQAVELVLWERLFRQCLALQIEQYLRGFLVVDMSALPIDEISLLPRLVDCLPAADGHLVGINISRLVHDMIEHFFNDHPGETAYRNFHWSIDSRDLPTFVFDFIRTHDCFHAGPNVIVTYPVYQYTNGVLSIVADLEWQGPDMPEIVQQGKQYRVENLPADSESTSHWSSLGFIFTPGHIHYSISESSPTVLVAETAVHFRGSVRYLRTSRYKVKEPTSWVMQEASDTATNAQPLSPKKRKVSQPKVSPIMMDRSFALDKPETRDFNYVPKRRKTDERLDTIMHGKCRSIGGTEIPIAPQLLGNPDMHGIELPERSHGSWTACFEKHSKHRDFGRIGTSSSFEHDNADPIIFSTDSIGEGQRLPSRASAEMEEKQYQRRDSATSSVRRQFRSMRLKSKTKPVFAWNLPVRDKKSSAPTSSPELPLSPMEYATLQHPILPKAPPSPPASDVPALPHSPDTEPDDADSPTTDTTDTMTSVPSQAEIQTNYREFEERKKSDPNGLVSPTAAEWEKWWYESGEGESGFSMSGVESGSEVEKSVMLEG